MIGTPVPAPADPVGYITDQWDAFVSIPWIDMQHRAALARQQYVAMGDELNAELARTTIYRLGELNKLHGATVDKLRGFGQWLGLGAIPPAALAAITALALIVAYLMAQFGMQSSVLEKLEAGTITPEDVAAAESITRPPVEILGGVYDIGKLLLWGVLAFFALEAFRRTPYASNPQLVTYQSNPPWPDDDGEHIIGENVYALAYQHADDRAPYVHNFGPDVEMYGTDDGDVLLRHRRGRRLWRDF